jgi:putative transposase
MASLFIQVLRVYMRASEFTVHEFVVMPDHVHLLLTIPGDTTLEKTVQLIKGNFSFRANRELDFRGEVWQRGFSDVRVTNEQSLQAHKDYIDSNPVRAGIADSAEDYPYCSTYLKLRKRAGAEARSSIVEGRHD